MSEINIEKDEVECLTEIINFFKTDAGNLLKKYIKDTHDNRVKDLIYSNKEDIFLTQGEVRAYSDIIGFLEEKSLKDLRESIKNNNNR